MTQNAQIEARASIHKFIFTAVYQMKMEFNGQATRGPQRRRGQESQQIITLSNTVTIFSVFLCKYFILFYFIIFPPTTIPSMSFESVMLLYLHV